jgi:hypothetical protein
LGAHSWSASRRDLHASVSGLQWTVDAYTLVLASFLVLAGFTADRVGRRRIFQVGLAAFGLGSLLCSLAPSIGRLIAARALQAVGGTMLNPVAMSIIATAFPGRAERARAIGVFGAMSGLSLGLGPILGGALVDGFGWRSIFWINVPIAADHQPADHQLGGLRNARLDGRGGHLAGLRRPPDWHHLGRRDLRDDRGIGLDPRRDGVHQRGARRVVAGARARCQHPRPRAAQHRALGLRHRQADGGAVRGGGPGRGSSKSTATRTGFSGTRRERDQLQWGKRRARTRFTETGTIIRSWRLRAR